METSKAITVLKNLLLHYQLLDKLWSIGLSPDSYAPGATEIGTAIFNWDENRKDIDEVMSIFFKHGDTLSERHKDVNMRVPDNILTDVAIDLFTDWKAFNDKQPIKA